MSDLTVNEICDRCKKSINILVVDFEQAMKDGDPLLCSDCEMKTLDEQAEVERPPKRCFEYNIIPIEGCDFYEHGKIGWELISIYDGTAYFKREYFYEKD